LTAPDGPSSPEQTGNGLTGLARTDPVLEQKLRDLRRMQLIATSLLVLMTLVFVATSYAASAHPALSYVRAFAEAAMVGACADWFAVVALFRRPFGLPIPHTGIIPQNKERIGAALGRFMSNNFLSPAVLAKRLDKLDAARYAADWLSNPDNTKKIADQAGEFLPKALSALPRDKLVEWASDATMRGLSAAPAAPLASKILALVWARGETQALLNRAIELAETSLLNNKEFIRDKVSERTSRFIPRWVDALLADRLMSGIQSSLGEMRRPTHPWRMEIKRTIETLIFDLANDPRMGERGEAFKRDLLANPTFAAQVRELCESLESQLDVSLTMHTAAISSGLEFALLAIGRWLREDENVQARINRFARRTALRAVSPRRAEIGAYIASVVSNWDATTLVNRLELQVGRDLQYIRINGTLVGGLVGLIIFIASKWLPAP
jgi:uncharacterized membrane-anchored protein YjiN (DUF445 family)